MSGQKIRRAPKPISSLHSCYKPMRTPDPYINQAVERGHYREIFEYCRDKTDLESIYWKCISLMWMGRKVELEEIFNEFDEVVLKSSSEFWKARYLMIRGIFHWGHEIYKAQSYFDRSFEISQHGDDYETIADYYIYSALVSDDPALKNEFYDKAMELSQKIGYTLGIFWCLGHQREQLHFEGRHEEAYELMVQRAELFKDNNKFWYSLGLGELANDYERKGDIAKAIELAEEANRLANECENGWEIANSYWRLSRYYKKKGDLPITSVYAAKATQQEMEMNHKSRIANSFRGRAEIFELMGELDKAMTFYQKALDMHFTERGHNQRLIEDKLAIARVHSLKHEVSTAIEILEEVIELATEREMWFMVSEALGQLIRIYSDIDRQKASSFLTDYELLHQNHPDDNLALQLKTSKAIYFKSSQRFKDKFKSQELFEELKDRYLDIGSDTLEIDLHLLELFLIEFESSGNSEIYGEIVGLINQVIKNASENNRYPIYIKVKLIHCQLLQVQGEFEEARSELDELIAFTEKRGLTEFKKMVKRSIQDIEANFGHLMNLVESNSSFSQLIRQTAIKKFIKEAQVVFNLDKSRKK